MAEDHLIITLQHRYQHHRLSNKQKSNKQLLNPDISMYTTCVFIGAGALFEVVEEALSMASGGEVEMHMLLNGGEVDQEVDSVVVVEA